jgi:16S rRNA processing protein RimM
MVVWLAIRRIRYLCWLMIRIGKIVAAHGLTGAVILTHVVGNSKWLKKEHVLHIEMQKGSYIPYFVAQCKPVNDKEYLVNIEQIETVEAAKKLVTKHVNVDESLLADYARQSPLLWIGFVVTDKHQGQIGAIEDVIQTGKQWLGKLTYKNSEVLIPLIEHTIEKVDIKAKTLNVDLPDGLLEVYLT